VSDPSSRKAWAVAFFYFEIALDMATAERDRSVRRAGSFPFPQPRTRLPPLWTSTPNPRPKNVDPLSRMVGHAVIGEFPAPKTEYPFGALISSWLMFIEANGACSRPVKIAVA